MQTLLILFFTCIECMMMEGGYLYTHFKSVLSELNIKDLSFQEILNKIMVEEEKWVIFKKG